MTDLVRVSRDLATPDERRVALERLNADAETAATVGDAHEVMVKGRVLTDALTAMRAPLEESRLAGKASVTAARRLALLLAELDGRLPGRHGLSQRGQARRDLGLGRNIVDLLNRLARIPDPDFQRYIQTTDRIPSINGAVAAAGTAAPSDHGHRSVNWRTQRRKKAGVTTPRNPSLDEAHSLVVRALGHVSTPSGGGGRRQTDIALAVDHLYAAEDLLRRHTGGYTK